MSVLLIALLPCELRILTPYYEQSTGTKISWGLFPFKCQYCPISFQLEHNVNFPFVHHWTCHSDVPLYGILFHFISFHLFAFRGSVQDYNPRGYGNSQISLKQHKYTLILVLSLLSYMHFIEYKLFNLCRCNYVTI